MNTPTATSPYGGLPTKSLGAGAGPFRAGLKGSHTISVTGSLGAAAGAEGAPVFDPEKLKDVLLVGEYGL